MKAVERKELDILLVYSVEFEGEKNSVTHHNWFFWQQEKTSQPGRPESNPLKSSRWFASSASQETGGNIQVGNLTWPSTVRAVISVRRRGRRCRITGLGRVRRSHARLWWRQRLVLSLLAPLRTNRLHQLVQSINDYWWNYSYISYNIDFHQ